MPQVGFEPTIEMYERAKTVHALDLAATVIGKIITYWVSDCVGVKLGLNAVHQQFHTGLDDALYLVDSRTSILLTIIPERDRRLKWMRPGWFAEEEEMPLVTSACSMLTWIAG
jgi:hypothetical protein